MTRQAEFMLKGVKVLDLSRLLPGPAATWFLQGMGAQVDRVEGEMGDMTRHLPPIVDGVGAYFSALSHGKRSIQLNLRASHTAELLKRMLHHYDVLVEGFKPGTLESIGLDPTELRQTHPRLIIARLSGYGQTGPYAKRVGHDINYLGLTGVLAAHRIHDEGHSLPAAQLADLGGALSAAMGICAALFGRTSSGEGRVLDVSLTESAMAMWAPMIAGFFSQGRDPSPGAEVLTGGASVYGTYKCSDGKYISLGVIEPKFQAALTAKLGELSREHLSQVFLSEPRDHWVDLLMDACSAPVLGVTEIANHPHHEARGVFQDGFIQPPFGLNQGDSPELGAHGQEILRECGFSDEEIAHCISNGALLS